MYLQPPFLKRGGTDLILTQAVNAIASDDVTGQVVRPTDQSQRDDLDRLEYASDEMRSSDEYDTDLETPEDSLPKANTLGQHVGRQTYLRVCRKLRINPISSVCRGLFSHELVISERRLASHDTLAICNALLDNVKVTKLVLDNNNLDFKSIDYICHLLSDHSSITSLSLADNFIEPDRLQRICDMLSRNEELTYLNLSGTRIQDDSAQYIVNALKSNKTLTTLILSHNQLGDCGAQLIGQAIASNEYLQEIDLSWNCIRPPGGVALGRSLRENVKLKTLRLGYNGLGGPGVTALAEALESNSILTELDMTCTRITDVGLSRLAKALLSNETLTHLRIAKNPLTTVSSTTLLSAINGNQNSALVLVDVSNIPIYKDAMKIIDQIKAVRPSFDYRSAGLISSNSDTTKGTGDARNTAVTSLRELFKSTGIIKVEKLLEELDVTDSGWITRQQFITLLETLQSPFSDDQIDQFVEILSVPEEDKISYRQLISSITNKTMKKAQDTANKTKSQTRAKRAK